MGNISNAMKNALLRLFYYLEKLSKNIKINPSIAFLLKVVNVF